MWRPEDVDLQMYYNGLFFNEEPFAGAFGNNDMRKVLRFSLKKPHKYANYAV